jgi:ribonucleoside-diphosphate reductase beta chain
MTQDNKISSYLLDWFDGKDNKEINREPLLDKNNFRLSILPIKYKDIWDMYKKHVSHFWRKEELTSIMIKDRKDWDGSLNQKEKQMTLLMMIYFLGSDNIVNLNIGDNLMSEICILEAKYFYSMQMLIENIHSETYSSLLLHYSDNERESLRLMKYMRESESIKKKAKWALQWQDNKKPFAERLLAQIFVEGIQFTSSFCIIFWFSSRNLLPALTKSNEWISRDEKLHTDFGVLLYTKYLINKLNEIQVHKMMNDVVEIEICFAREAIPDGLPRINKDLMEEYIKYKADELLLDLGYSKLYKAANPFTFSIMAEIKDRRSDFFTDPSSTYKFGSINDGDEDWLIEDSCFN